MDNDHTVEIDGSVLEGGGQILRMAIAFSVLQKIPIRIFNIRAGRSKPGLSPQHLKGLELARDLTCGQLSGAQERSMEVVFKPGQLRPGNYKADIGTAGSVALVLQMVLPCALFNSGATVVDLRGGTNVEMAPQIDYITTVFLSLLKKFGASFLCDVILRGYYPQGRGEIRVKIAPVRQLMAVDLVEPGKVRKVWGTAFTAGNCKLIASKQMGQAAENELGRVVPLGASLCIEQINEPPERAFGTAYGIYVFAETTTDCVLGGSGLGRRDLRPHFVGLTAALELSKSIETSVCLDSHAQDQVVILMALAKGKSRMLCGPITLHTETAIYIAQLMTKAKFTIHKKESDRNIIECEGIGMVNDHM